MQDTITGFQFDPKTGRYIGEYEFPNNMDKEEIHIPPNTTLERPPAAAVGQVVVRVGDNWELQNAPDLLPKKPLIDSYLMLTENFIVEMQNQGLWTSEDQRLRDEAIAENERKKNEANAAYNASEGSAV